MKVAVLAHSFPRFRGDTHGPFVKALCEALARRGHEIHALIPFDPAIEPDPAASLKVRSFRYVWPDSAHLLGYSRTLKRDRGMKYWAWLEAPFYHLFAVAALTRLVREESIELVHAHWVLPNGFVAARVRQRTGVPYAVTLHGSDVFMAERNSLLSAMARSAVRGAAHVTSCSADLSSRLLALAGNEHAPRMVLLANGTDPIDPEQGREAAAGIRAKLGIDASARLVVAVGRLVDKKGFRHFLDAAPGVLASDPALRFVLGGGGELEAELRAQARALGIAERVTFTGTLSHDQVLGLVASAEVFVMPSIRDPAGNIDGLPIVVLEAMAAGVPVVATAVSGIPLAVVDGVTGVLVPEADPLRLAAGIRSLLEDPVRARSMGEAGRSRVACELNWDAIAERHDRLYRVAVPTAR